MPENPTTVPQAITCKLCGNTGWQKVWDALMGAWISQPCRCVNDRGQIHNDPLNPKWTLTPPTKKPAQSPRPA